MGGYLSPDPGMDLRGISVLGIAHIGDAVFELMARTWLYTRGASTAQKLHAEAVKLVSAKAQAIAAKRLLPELCEDELVFFKRGRNAYAGSIPRGCSVEEYHAATGVETLFGYLYISGQQARLNKLFELLVAEM